MRANRTKTEKKRAFRNQHHRAKAIPKVQKLINIVRNGWAAMGPLERGQRLGKLVSLGCSRRGLERELKVSATSVRRHMEIAGLPQDDLKAIEAGVSAKAILARKATSDRRRRIQERVDEDQKTGALSDEIATIILEFCRSGYELRKDPMIGRIFPLLLDRVESLVGDFEASGRRAVKVSKKLDRRTFFRKTRPRAAKGTAELVRQANWLAEVLSLIAPESQVRANAILKARRRAGELLPKRTPSELREDAVVNSLVRNIELFNLPPRKFYPGGARSMLRQGRPSQPQDPKCPGKTELKS